MPFFVGDAAAKELKVYIPVGLARITGVVVYAVVVGLPDFHHGAFHRFAFLVENRSVHVDEFAGRFFLCALHPGEVVIHVRIKRPLGLGRGDGLGGLSLTRGSRAGNQK